MTSRLLALAGGAAVDASRGEPAFVFRIGDMTLGLVIEGVGTKTMICRTYEEATGVDLWAGQGHDGVAMVVNDLICVGALPLVVNAYFATGSAEWFGDDGHRIVSLSRGWREACEVSGATWGGGESPTLPGLLTPGELDLAGCAVGRVPDGVEPILGADLSPGDRIVFLNSSGLHANGASLARRVIDELPEAATTKLPSGTALGEALLEPTANYVPVVRALLEQRVPVTYLSAITGHGLRKVMRPQRELRYRVSALPEVPEVLQFLASHLGLSDHDAYGTFNMGAGFAVYVRPEAAADTIAVAAAHGFTAIDAGVVEEGSRSVVVEPIGATYADEELRLR
jgi:phosphoribosylformylglycinamidine cyclo-ligase